MIEERKFFSGLNSDSEDRSLENGDYRYSLNMEISNFDGSNVGVVVNSLGNRLIEFNLPVGVNTCIGTKSDDENVQIYYFVHNSQGNHGIYRFDVISETITEVLSDPVLNLSLTSRVNHINVVNNLLYWTEASNPQRKINIDKAIDTGKTREFNIYFKDMGQTYSTVLKDENGVQLAAWVFTGTSTDLFSLANEYVTNVPPLALTFADFKTCGAQVKVTFKNPGRSELTVNSAANQVMVVGQNFYPRPMIEEFIDRLKQPFHHEPKVAYKQDPTKKTNLVQNMNLQFRVRYVYDDHEISPWSPISMIPLSGTSCGNSGSSSYNYIEVDFTDPRLNNPNTLAIISRVDLAFRNHNDGKFYFITSLDPYEFGIGRNFYNFYNDGIYSIIPDSESNENFDSMFITAGGQEFVGNRLFDTDGVEGYDTVCVDAEVNIAYTPPPTVTLVNLFGNLAIINSFAGHTYSMPIFTTPQDSNGGNTIFGGVGFPIQPPAAPVAPKYFVNSIASRYNQSIPLAGFVLYLAGTSFHGVSVQRKIYSGQDAKGIANVTDYASYVSLHNTIESTGFISDWKIEGVPPGVYSLRVASHLTTADELNSGSLEYQRTSTTINSRAGVCGSGKTEVIVEVLSNGTINLRDPDTYSIIYTDAFGYCRLTEIQDLTCIDSSGPPGTNESIGIMGYIADSEDAGAPPTVSDALGLERVTKSFVRVDLYVNNPVAPIAASQTTYSDHNGFYYSRFDIFIPYDYTVKVGFFSNITSAVSAPLSLYDPYSYPSTFTQVVGSDYRVKMGIYIYDDAVFTDNVRTFIDGVVLDSSGNPASGVNVVIPYHGSDITDASGSYSISYYNHSATTNNGMILASSNGLCAYTVSGIPINFSILINSSNYNNSNHYSASVINVVLSVFSLNAYKKGSDINFGIVYYDRGNRSTTVNTNQSLFVHIPFYTEATGTPAPLDGIPTLSWIIRHVPPAWATHWQWVRTMNLQINNYLQFIAKEVKYVDQATAAPPANIVAYSRSDYMRINIGNLIDYKDQNANSTLSYTFQKGDRIRFIRDENGNFYPSYFDFEIEGAVAGSAANDYYIFVKKDAIFPEQQNGIEFEIYTPKLNLDEKLFYEIGECYEVGHGVNGAFHKGQTDQDPLNPFTVPATGTFSTGNAYYRRRRMSYLPSSGSTFLYTTLLIDDASTSDFFVSKDDQIGRVNIEDNNIQQLYREKSIRFSDIYLEDTQVNGLSSWGALNVETIQKGQGRIYKLQRSGRVLLAIQRSQCNSLYINEIVYIDASGNPSLTVSDKVIGTIYPLEVQMGTINPESVQEYEGKIYFFDQHGGNVVRYSNNGLTPINYYKMVSHFRDIALQMQKLPGSLAIGGIDSANKRYSITFTGIPVPETVNFSELTNRWTHYSSYLGEAYSFTGMVLVSFKDGQLWVHDNPIRMNYYGVQYTGKILVTSNENNGKVRTFISTSQECTDSIGVPEITIPRNAQYPNGMDSRLLKSKFVAKEGVYYAAFLRDLNTPNVNDPLINGRALRGHVLNQMLETTSTTEIILNAVNIKYIFSEYSKK